MEEKETINIDGKMIGVIVILLLLVGSTFGMFFMDKSNKTSLPKQVIENKASTGLTGNQIRSNSGEMPEKCRLPSGQNVESWKEHLGHHSETRDCLEYFK